MIKEYPLHIDIFALFIFLGAIQGIFLSYFFLHKANRTVKANIFIGLLLVASSLLCLDILFSYTNFMFQVIYLVDATEPFNLLVGPLFYLYIAAKLDETKIKYVYYHFIPFVAYSIYTLPFHIGNLPQKYNSYLDQYHPGLDYISVPTGYFSDPLLLKGWINELTILSISVYLTVSAIKLLKSQKNITQGAKNSKLFRFLWLDIGLMTSILLILVFVKLYYPNDLGDYIIIIAICVFIYSVSFKIIRESVFFTQSKPREKYGKSALDENTKLKILQKLSDEMELGYYKNPTVSLPDLSKRVNTSPNYLSQVINEKLNLTFLELINKYRIDEAKMMILDQNLNETIEGIGYLVGFNSKSTFHSAFKKNTGQTPAEYKNSNNNVK